MDFFSWDDEWGDASARTGAPAPAEPVMDLESTNHGYDKVETQPIIEETHESKVEARFVEAAPVKHVEQPPMQDWYGDDWGNAAFPVAEPEPVVQQPVAKEPVPEPVPEPEVVVAPPKRAAPQRAAPKPQTNSWSKEPSTSLFTTPATKQPKQKKVVKAPQKQKKQAEKKRQPVPKKAAPKKAAQPVVAAAPKANNLSAENKSLKNEVAELRTQLDQINQRLLGLEHSKHILYNSVCTLNSSGHTHEGRVCWTNEYGGDILPAQRLAYELTEDGTGISIMMDGLYEISFNTYGTDPKIQINNETYATGHTNNSSCYLSICVYVAEQPTITCLVENPMKGNACDHWLSIRRFPS